MPIDMSKYLGLFASEALEHLEGLARELVRLEQEKSRTAVDAMFRHAHSVKGMAASMGFEQIAVLAHRIEDLVAEARSRPDALDADTTDVLLAATDHLTAMVKAAGAGVPWPDALPLIERLGGRLLALTGQAPGPTRVIPAFVSAAEPIPVLPEPEPQALPPHLQVKVKIAPSCVVPGVRAFLVHKKLASLGNIFTVRPPLEDLKAGRIPEGMLALEIEVQGAHGTEAIQRALSTVADLETVDISPVEARSQPAPAPTKPEPEPPRPLGVEPARTVRVKTEILDYFLDSAGELLLAVAHLREVTKAVPEAHRTPVEAGVDRLRALVKDLHDKVMSVRMTPLSLITDRLPRAARDIARKKGREVDLVIAGTEIELDRAILDELADPLLHILRNCIDHGLEDPEDRSKLGKGPRGRIVVAARRDRDRVLLEIEDDGRGMDVARLKAVALERGLITEQAAATMGEREALLLCCLPGVSTAEAVTDVSGRGVGMDAVKRAVESVGGTLDIDSQRGHGTRFTLRLPLTVAVVNVLLVGVGHEVFGLPIAKVRAVVEVVPETLSRSRNAPMLSHDGALLPVHVLAELLRLERTGAPGARPHVVVEAEPGPMALEVDRLLGQEEAVLKPVSRPLDLLPGLAGVTILGTGRPIFILDLPRLVP
ncbi:MAG: chemotaxis protein CheA [Deltaproteobacteria bacterium]|nr:chemotaxis protein CheA [Deltaproteobacteria bacterium]